VRRVQDSDLGIEQARKKPGQAVGGSALQGGVRGRLDVFSAGIENRRMETHASICRFCHANCGILVDVEEGRPVRVRGDDENPGYHGYTCAKGRQLPLQHAHPDRLLHSLARGGDGVQRPIESGRAMDEVAERVGRLVEEHGPNSVAIYIGTFAGPHPASAPTAVGFTLALGSRMVFTAASIDQPGKSIANALHGRWLGGSYAFDESDRWMLVGNNPLVSMSGGIPPANPGRRLREAKARGMQLVVIDPRRSEVSRFADVYLQPRPGEDPTLLASMAHVILRDGLADAAFLSAHASGLDSLRGALAPFAPAYASARVDVPAADIERAAEVFASGRRGCAVAGTGPNMAPRGNLSEYLLQCLNTLCGYWRREGEPVANPGVLIPEAEGKAQATPPRKAWGYGDKLRVRGFTSAASGLPTAALADEILLEGEGQIRALFCIGSNPIAAWPDQRRTEAAMRKLDLLVCLDMKRSATARMADYVIAPKLSLEVPGITLSSEGLEQVYVGHGYSEPYAQYSPVVVDPPEGSDVLEEWEFFYGLAQRMGLTLQLHPVRSETGVQRGRRRSATLDMARKPTTDEVYASIVEGSRVPLEALKQHPHGGIFPAPQNVVAPADPGWEGRLCLDDPTMLEELASVREEVQGASAELPYRLISRRMPNVYNSSGRDLPQHLRRRHDNPAFMHPEDLHALGVEEGALVRIRSAHDAIVGVVAAEAGLRRGVVSMSHCFGDVPGHDGDVRAIGSNTGRLVSVEHDYDPYSGIPRMSAIPVQVEPVSG
jgi:anaerobic selenocysteine-containing dehydrogenase